MKVAADLYDRIGVAFDSTERTLLAMYEYAGPVPGLNAPITYTLLPRR